MHDILSKVPLLESLSPDDLEKLGARVTERRLAPDEILFEEGSPGDACFIIADGELAITKRSAGNDVLVAVRVGGEVVGEMALIDDAPRVATVRARAATRLIEIAKSDFDAFLSNSPSAAMAMLQLFASRMRSMQATLHHSEKMAALGTMTAGVAHELNNPAAAARRAVEQLGDMLGRLQQAERALSALQLGEAQLAALNALRGELQAVEPTVMDTMARSDLEYALEQWLDERGAAQGWELAPLLANAGLTVARLDQLATEVDSAQLPTILAWLATSHATYSLLAEVRYSAGRISAIVNAMKEYAFLDQAPVQAVDLAKSIDNTLIMLQHKLKAGIAITREFAPDLPPIVAYGSELSQVWTNLIDNAADAMGGQGSLRIRAYPDGNAVIVQIADSGPGIPPAMQERIFDPFFTTKDPGKGTGLGLYICRQIIEKHRGQLSLVSAPGETIFEIRLPVDFNSG